MKLLKVKQRRQRPRRADATLDHSDIRGSGQARRHGRDPSGAASD